MHQILYSYDLSLLTSLYMNDYRMTRMYQDQALYSSLHYSPHNNFVLSDINADQFKKRSFNQILQDEEPRFSEKQNELKSKLVIRNQMIAFYKEQAMRRQKRHQQAVISLRQQKTKQIQKSLKLVKQFRDKNAFLQNEQESARNSLSYSAIHDNTSFDDQDILNSLAK